MDDPDITMEEYIRLEEEKAQRRGQNFNWKSATYAKVKYFEDIDYFKDFETEFPAIVFNDNSISKLETQPKPTFKFTDMAPLPPRDQRHLWIQYRDEAYTEEVVYDFEVRLETIFRRQVNRVHVLDFEGLTGDMRIGDEMDLDASDILCFQLGGNRWSMMWRQFILALVVTRPRFPPIGTFWGKLPPIYASEICMDQEAANVPYLLAQYLFRHAEGRKSGARLLGGYFIGRLAHHFGLGLGCPKTREAADGATGPPKGVEGAPIVDEGAQDAPAPVQAPPPPTPATGRTIPQRVGRHEEEIHGLRQDIGSLRRLIERSMTDQSKFSTWMISCITQLMEASGQSYQSFDGTL
ncbi:hypothetical protein Tco_1438586 [Tanacetum coccineum]